MNPYATIRKAENGYSVDLCLAREGNEYEMDVRTYVFPTMDDVTEFVAKKLK